MGMPKKAAPRLTREQIFAELDRMAEEGAELNAPDLRTRLGSGSYSFIIDVMAEWITRRIETTVGHEMVGSLNTKRQGVMASRRFTDGLGCVVLTDPVAIPITAKTAKDLMNQYSGAVEALNDHEMVLTIAPAGPVRLIVTKETWQALTDLIRAGAAWQNA